MKILRKLTVSKFIKISLLALFSYSFIFAQVTTSKIGAGEETEKAKIDALIIEEIITEPTTRKVDDTQVIDTEYFRITLRKQGASIISFKHKDEEHKLKHLIELILKGEEFSFVAYPFLKGKTELESQEKSRKAVTVFKNLVYNTTVQEEDDKVVLEAKAPIVFRANGRRESGSIIKTFTFFKKLHYWKFDWALRSNRGKPVLMSNLYFDPFSPIGPAAHSDNPREGMAQLTFYYANNDEFKKFALSEDGGGCTFYGGGDKQEEPVHAYPTTGTADINYFGSSSRFMLISAQPLDKTKRLISLKADKHLQVEMADKVLGPEDSFSFIIYTGPKVKDYVNVDLAEKKLFPDLKKLHPDLDKAFDFGITAPVRDLIVWFLQVLYQVIPNYGIGIILFALLFKLVFWPLNQKQAESMKKMQALQPQLKEINEKYKENPQEKQKRIMKLYKEKKVNPLGGCLPMLIQLPIFIALYTAFSDAYELWKSPFITGWINDLSEPDTVYRFTSLPIIGTFNLNILPLLMTGSQFLQSKFTMVTGGDGQQKLMMQLMPLMLLFFFWSMPSGVVLYWTVQNVLSIAQQIYTNKREDKANGAASK